MIREKINLKFIIITITALIICSTFKAEAQNYSWSPLLHNNAGNGTNGNVYAITAYQNNIVVAGGFSQAGGINANNIAIWNGTTWSALGSGIGSAGDTVYALAVFNNELYAGGNFSTPASNIAKWSGTSWVDVGGGVNGEVKSMMVFNSALAVGGDFDDRGNKIASWTGTAWSTFGQGFNTSGGSKVFALAIFNTQLIAAGRFQLSGTTPVNNIAAWTGSSWQPLGTGLGVSGDRVFALTVYNSTLVAGGRFLTAGGSPAAYIAKWTGSAWQNVGAPNDLDDEVEALASYNNDLIVGGNFRFVSGSLYLSRIGKWNGTLWSRMETGAEDKVNALWVKDTSLYAGGEFSYAGGRIANHIARWFNHQTDSISGHVKYADNGNFVLNGKVKAFRIDAFTRELILVDSAVINNGAYIIGHGTIDTLRVIAFPNDELDFVPTYYPNTIDWRLAVIVIPGQNSTNIDINVYRVTPGPVGVPLSATIGGHIYLNINIPGNLVGSYPYQKDAILYVKQDSLFRKFAVSHDDESYTTTMLNAGTYNLYVYRSGYTYAARNVTLGATNLDTINFYLDTLSLIGLHNISTSVPKSYMLGQNYPNPFNPATNIKFSIHKTGFVSLSVYNILGQEIAVLVNEELKQGEYKFVFDALNLPSGIYFYTLKTGSFAETKKMVLIK